MIYFINGKMRFRSEELDRKVKELKEETTCKKNEREIAVA